MRTSLATLSGILLVILLSRTATAAPWITQAKTAFEKDQYEKVIDIAQDHKKDKNSKMSFMLLAFSHLQLHEYNGTKSDKKYFNNYIDLLEDRVGASHLKDIRYFTEQNDKPEVVDKARSLLKYAFKSIRQVEDIAKVLPFTHAEDKKTRKMALSVIEDIVEIKRKYVNKGGTLRKKDIAVLDEKKLIQSLLENIDISAAFSALLAIEQPVLAHISGFEGKKIMKLEEKIRRAIRKREKKDPNSTWSSIRRKS